MVRLKGAVQGVSHQIHEVFQFHNGSIKSESVFEDAADDIGFNSTMVRLKV